MSEVNFETNATGAGLIRFLDYAIEKGHLKLATGRAMRSAVKEVLSSTEGADAWESVELDSLDVEDTQRRFETVRAMKFSSGSLGTYKSRFRKALAMFSDFRESPSTWRPSVQKRDRKPREPIISSQSDSTPQPPGIREAEPPAPRVPPRHPSSPRSAIITYPFPVRDGVLASLELPADLTGREAERVAAFVASLAVEERTKASGTAPDDEG